MMSTLRRVILAAALGGTALAAQEDSEVRIRRVADGLLPPVVLAGQPVRTSRLEDRMRELNIPGVSVAVFRDGKIEWVRGWGVADAASKRPLGPDTRFQAASISKPVAAAAALALVARGRLALDEDITGYLKTWTLPPNEFTAARKVTLRHLLSHTGGVTVSGFRGYAAAEPVPTLRQLLDGAQPANSAPIRVDSPVGRRWRYSGGGYSIVQQVIEDVTGRPFADAARELVLEPAGMSRSTFAQPLPAALHGSAARAHRADGSPVPGGWHTYPEAAAAGLWTTPEDLARFAIAVQQAAAGARSAMLPRDLARQMLTAVADEYGLGFGIEGEGRAIRFGHGGSNAGFRCYLVCYRDMPSGVAIMSNGDLGGAILEDVVRAVAREYGWPGLEPIERTLGTADPATYGDFAGDYEIPVRSPPVVLRITTENNRLYRGAGRGRTELLPENATTFFALDSDFRVEFVRDGSGRVTEARVREGDVERRGTRRAGS